MNLAARLEANTMPVPESGCRLWLGFINDEGYGVVGVGGRQHRAHRAAYELERGPIPAGLHLDHLCRVRCCVNPAHLDPVTPRENLMRSENSAAKRAAQTHCKRGHKFTPENTKRRPSRPTQRECRKCCTTMRNFTMPREPQVAAIAVRLIPLEHLAMLEAGARRDGLTREQLVRKLIAEWVEKNCEAA